MERGAKTVWDLLPGYFGLGKWENLKGNLDEEK
jgi:hypothetical protein